MLSQEDLERGDISMELASRMMNRTYYETEKIRKGPADNFSHG